MAKKERPKIDEEWMTSYTDMVTLLMCFFVVMLSASKFDAVKFEQVRASMNQSLSRRTISNPIESMLFELKEDIRTIDGPESIALGTDARGIVIEFSGDTTFDQGSADIKPEMLPHLKRIAATLRSERYQNFTFSVEGHTSDENFSNSRFPSNWELSSARASTIARFLESRGIERFRLRATGMYDIAPKYPNFNPFGEPIPENRKRNRRVVIHVEPSFDDI